MSDIFISYARSTEKQAQTVAEALRALGYSVWRDDELPSHRAYGDVIEEQHNSAKAVLVIWSAEAVKSQWVRSEADRAREKEKLVQFSIDGVRLPMPFDQIQCANLTGWAGDLDSPAWRKVVGSLAELIGTTAGSPSLETRTSRSTVQRRGICVLPFANMSGDAEQEYFSDGISEDIITDLAKVSALSVVARNTAFTFKGKAVDVPEMARQLNVSHVLEGSVRKAGNRVRITAQLIDGVAGDHIWAERWDRDLDDIFALQDEIAQAIVAALKLKLLPEERQSIERRETNSADAYNLYLKARQIFVSGNSGDVGKVETTVRLCQRATEIDPAYARAWALMARAQATLQFQFGRGVDGRIAAERALALDPNLGEPHAVKARYLSTESRHEEASAEIKVALDLEPESYDVNFTAATLSYRKHRVADATHFFEKAAALVETDINSAGVLAGAYEELGEIEASRRAAAMTLDRAEKALALDSSDGAAMSWGAIALAILGETDQARNWVSRALAIEPDNMLMRYNLACVLIGRLKDADAGLDHLGPFFEATMIDMLDHAKADTDLASIRDDPRFKTMVAAAEARLAARNASPTPTPS
jgi:adenylate cyclase